jgi:exopolysaccharide/PEP-CTERM locus tyrosine autokinase
MGKFLKVLKKAKKFPESKKGLKSEAFSSLFDSHEIRYAEKGSRQSIYSQSKKRDKNEKIILDGKKANAINIENKVSNNLQLRPKENILKGVSFTEPNFTDLKDSKSFVKESEKEYLAKNVLDKDIIGEKLMDLRRKCSQNTCKKIHYPNKISKKSRKNELFTFYSPNSDISEHFKIIRTIILNLENKKSLKTILVTSALPKEGKSFITSNLAVSIARGFDKYVLLVDADLKRPSLHEFFEIDADKGLCDFLTDHQLELSSLIKKTKIEKLSLLPSGSCLENSSELLSSEVMSLFIQEIKNRYDDRHIIIDSLPAQFSETLALVEKVDGVIIVVKSGKTNKELVAKTIDTIGKKKVIGVILNYGNLELKKYYKDYNMYYKKLA